MPASVDITQLSRYTTLWRLIASDGTGFDVTTGTREVVWDGVTYTPTNVKPSPEQLVENLDPSNCEVALSMSAAGITEEDVLGGRWDGARVEIRHYDWFNDEVDQAWRGVLNSVVYDNDNLKAEVLDVSVIFTQAIGSLYQDSCRAEHGDAACGRTPAVEEAVPVETFTGRDEFTVAGTLPEDGWFDNGKVVFVSGANAGLSKEIRSCEQTAPGVITIRLIESMRHAIAAGVEVDLHEGCAKTFLACIKKGNAKRARFEPGIPGRNKLFSWPK